MDTAPMEPDISRDELTFNVLLFGALKDAAGGDTIQVRAPSTLSVATLLPFIATQYPALEQYLPHVRVAVNFEYSTQDQSIQSGDEIALIPPVAGG